MKIFLFVLFFALTLGAPHPAWGQDAAGPDAAPDAVSEAFSARLQELRTVLRREGDYQRGEEMARKLLKEVEQSQGKGSFEAAWAIDFVVEAMLYQGEGTKAECRVLAERALAIKQRVLGPNHKRIPATLERLGQIEFQKRNFDKSRGLFERALSIRETVLGPDALALTTSLESLANIDLEEGKLDDAMTRYRRELGIIEKANGMEHPRTASVLYNMARLQDEMLDFEGALASYQRSRKITESTYGSDHVLMAYILNGEAQVMDWLGDYVRAREKYEEALSIAEAALPDDHYFLAACRNNLGFLLSRIGDMSSAGEVFEQALEGYRANPSDHAEQIASTMASLAGVLQAEGRHAEALTALEEALELKIQAVGPEEEDVASILERLGRAHLAQGSPDEAVPYLRRALNISETQLDPAHPDVGRQISLLAYAQTLSPSEDADETDFLRALNILESKWGSEHPEVAETLHRQSVYYHHHSEYKKAFAVAQRAERISLAQVKITSAALPERQALAYTADRVSGRDVMIDAARNASDPQLIREAWNAVIQSRGLVLESQMQRLSALRASDTPEIAHAAEELSRASKRLANLLVRGSHGQSPGRYQGIVREYRKGYESAQRRLYAIAPESQTWEASLSEIQTRLPEGTALVGITRAASPTNPDDADYIAFVLPDQDARPRLVELGTASVIDALISRWRGTILGFGDDDHAVGTQVREGLWDPVAAVIPGADLVLLVPDGALHQVSFAALPRKGGGFVVEDGRLIHYLTSERDAALPATTNLGKGLLVVGGSDYDLLADASLPAEPVPTTDFRSGLEECEGLGSHRFEPLPGTGREAEAIAALWKTANNGSLETEPLHLLSRTRATEASVKEELSGRRAIHLATHGFYLNGTCAPSAASRRGIGGLSPERRPLRPQTENPLRLTGLALTGANRRSEADLEEDDGILTAQEVSTLDLRGTELAVLSACDTGTGDILIGEGILGLRRAFQAAGTRTLVTSLWPVDDEATQRWMVAFYRSLWLDKLGVAGAVRAACIAEIEHHRSQGSSPRPFIWGGFVAAGNWN